MNRDIEFPRPEAAAEPASDYQPPAVSFLGTLAELTQEIPPGKDVGAADGTQFLGLDVGS